MNNETVEQLTNELAEARQRMARNPRGILLKYLETLGNGENKERMTDSAAWAHICIYMYAAELPMLHK